MSDPIGSAIGSAIGSTMIRRLAEWLLRAIAIAAVAVVLWRWLAPAPAEAARPEVVTARGDALGTALQRWTTAPAPAAHVALDGAPDAAQRAWLRALARAGMRVGWSAPSAAPIAVAASAVVDPAGGVRVDVAGRDTARIAVGDALAASDTALVRGAGASVTLPTVADTVLARAGGTVARVPAPAAVPMRDVLVLGRAGWEAKFVAAALEERGWRVRARLAVAPGIAVTEAGTTATAGLAADTARVAAVVVLDSGAVDASGAATLARYVRSGGGLVLAGDAAAAPALQALAPGRMGAAIPGAPGAVDGATPRRGLALAPIEALRADAIVLERREGERGAGAPVAVAARRVGGGRVAQVGYAETWRWRMAVPDASPAAHRAWWARVLAAVAHAPPPAAPAADPLGAGADPAPLAATVAAIGAPSAAPAGARPLLPTRSTPGDGVLVALAGTALLAEVASRRLRGAR